MKKFEYLEVEPTATTALFRRGLEKSFKGAFLSSNAKPLIDKIVGTFLCYLSASASDLMTDKQKTITPEHIYKTLKEMDFEDFIPILKRSEARENELATGKKREREKKKEEKEEQEKKEVVTTKEKDSEDESENESEEEMEEDEKKENTKTKGKGKGKGKGKEKEKDTLKPPSPKKFKFDPNSDEDEESDEQS